jgi:hypothetical protein
MSVRLSNTIRLFKGDEASPEGFANDVTHVIDFNGPQMTNERVEVTDGDSPLNAKEYLSGRQDLGPLSFTLNYDFQQGDHVTFVADAQASPPVNRNYRLQPSAATGDYLQGRAFVNNFAISGSSRNQALTAAVALQPTQAWSITAAA